MKSPALKSTTQRRLAIAGLLLLAPTLGACGFSAQTDQVYQAAVGVNNRTGDVDILNAVIVSATDGSGTFAGTLVNKTDALVQVGPVTGDGITTETGGGETLTVAAHGYNNLGEAGETVPPAKLTLSGPADKIAPGRFVDLTFTFSSGSSITIKVPVVGVTADYTDVPLPANPTGKKSGDAKLDEPDASPAAE